MATEKGLMMWFISAFEREGIMFVVEVLGLSHVKSEHVDD